MRKRPERKSPANMSFFPNLYRGFWNNEVLRLISSQLEKKLRRQRIFILINNWTVETPVSPLRLHATEPYFLVADFSGDNLTSPALCFLSRSSTAATISGRPIVASTKTSPKRPPSAGGTNLPQETASL